MFHNISVIEVKLFTLWKEQQGSVLITFNFLILNEKVRSHRVKFQNAFIFPYSFLYKIFAKKIHNYTTKGENVPTNCMLSLWASLLRISGIEFVSKVSSLKFNHIIPTCMYVYEFAKTQMRVWAGFVGAFPYTHTVTKSIFFYSILQQKSSCINESILSCDIEVFT